MAMHYVQPDTIVEPADGYVYPVCACGKKLGVYPGAEEAADALMGHAYEQGWLDAKKEGNTGVDLTAARKAYHLRKKDN